MERVNTFFFLRGGGTGTVKKDILFSAKQLNCAIVTKHSSENS